LQPLGARGLGRDDGLNNVRYGYIGEGSESESFNGTNEISNPARNLKYYTGKLDEVRLWHTARTQNEINDNRFVRLSGCEEGLVLYYDFNEGGGTEIYDKAMHTYALFNGGIDWETGSGPIEDCANLAPDSNPIVAGIGGYRYGFQGQEKDDEIKGAGNSVNFKYRVHDPRLGRFFAVDPLIKKYPHYSSYSFSGNKVIAHIEIEGLEDIYYLEGTDSKENAAMALFKASSVGNELIEHFTNEELNNGYDIIFYQDNLKDSKGRKQNGTTNFMPFSAQGDGITDLEMKYNVVLSDIKSNPSKKGVIFIGLNSGNIEMANSSASKGEWEEGVSDYSLTIAHELRIHAIPDMEGKSRPIGEEHEDYHKDPVNGQNPGRSSSSPTPDQIRNLLPNSMAGQDLKRLDYQGKTFERQKRVQMTPIESKNASPIN
jgi:RHS repeat-associated protein